MVTRWFPQTSVADLNAPDSREARKPCPETEALSLGLRCRTTNARGTCNPGRFRLESREAIFLCSTRGAAFI